MDSVYQKMKALYIDYYMETRNQERLIVSGDYKKVNELIDRKQSLIQQINNLDKNALIGKGEELVDIIGRTIKLEKKNNIVMNAALVDHRFKLKAHRNKKNNIMRYSMNR